MGANVEFRATITELIGNIVGEWIFEINTALRKEFFAIRAVREAAIRDRLRVISKAQEGRIRMNR